MTTALDPRIAPAASPAAGPDAIAVRAMFDRIAGRYDLVNTVLSAGADARWRQRAARAAAVPPAGRALDIACGSGKLAGEILRSTPRVTVIGLDFSGRMLDMARSAVPGATYVRGDGLRLPFAAGLFDSVTLAFGLRNFADPEGGLREMRRVLKPGGRAVVLEFVRPPVGVLGAAYRAYLMNVLPAIGGLISRNPDAYAYLARTVNAYRTPAELVALAAAAGWRGASINLLTLGTVGVLAGRS